MRYARRWTLIVITALTVIAITGTAVLAFIVDRSQCHGAAQAIDNSRTMWVYLIEQNPGPEADEFLAEMNRRIPPAHCRGGSLIVDEADTTGTTVPDATNGDP